MRQTSQQSRSVIVQHAGRCAQSPHVAICYTKAFLHERLTMRMYSQPRSTYFAPRSMSGAIKSG